MTIEPGESGAPQKRVEGDGTGPSCHKTAHMNRQQKWGWVPTLFDSWATTFRVTVFAVALLVAAMACLWLLGIEVAVGPVQLHK
jgi:hypothetical protein